MKEIYLTDQGRTITDQELENALEELLRQYPDLKKVLIIPPDFTRCYSYGGVITQMLYRKLAGSARVDVIPALGTHMPLDEREMQAFFGDVVPRDHILVHDWQTDTVSLGEVPAEFCSEVSGDRFTEPVEVELNHLLIDGGYDLILSVGQVVPHEVVGLSNYSKNIFVGLGGGGMINKSHMISALCGIENALGVTDAPARKVFDYAQEHFIDGKIPLVYILTVMTVEEKEQLKGLFIGDSRKAFEEAAELSKELNITYIGRPARKVVAYLDPMELKSTWVGNKGIYRTRMIVADGGELLLLAPGVRSFGENEKIDAIIRRYGYCGTKKILKLYREGAFDGAFMSAAHEIHGSSEGRFTITYATKPEHLSKEEVESVGFGWMDYEEATARYNPEVLRDGWNTMPDGEEIYYVSKPATGLWKI